MNRIVALACALAVQLIGHAQAEELRIGWVYAMANAPVLIAEREGYFREQGLQVRLLSFTSGPLLKQAMVAGELDLAYIGSAPIYHWLSRGLKSKILAKVNYGQAALTARADTELRTLADLRGAIVAGVRTGSGMDVLLRGYVLGETARLVPGRDLQIIAMPAGNMGLSLQSKVVGAAFMWEPFVTQSVLRDNARVIFDVNQAEPRYPWYVISAPAHTLEERPDEIVGALRAHRRAVDFLNSGEDAGNDVIAHAFQLEPIDGADGRKYSGADVVKLARQRLGWSWRLDARDEAFIQRLMGWSYDLGYINQRLSAADLIDRRFADRAARQSGRAPVVASPVRARGARRQSPAVAGAGWP